MKKCATCQKEKEAEDFPSNVSTKDGLHQQCRACKVRNNRRVRGHDGKTKTYFVRGKKTGLIKIGITAASLKYRMIVMRSNSPDELEVLKVANFNMEKILHDNFESARAHGEWFHPTEELMQLIESLK